jgi:hypothetical protein
VLTSIKDSKFYNILIKTLTFVKDELLNIKSKDISINETKNINEEEINSMTSVEDDFSK